MTRIVRCLSLPLLLVITGSWGCDYSSTEDATGPDITAPTTNGEEEHDHEHGSSDELAWPLKEKLADSGFEIWLGHHGTHFHGGDNIEPAISITKDGEAYANATVFNGLVNPDHTEAVSMETLTIYEPVTEHEIAHYAQGELAIPEDAKEITVRYRISIPEITDEIIRDVNIEVGH